jgi:hypothetical protein
MCPQSSSYGCSRSTSTRREGLPDVLDLSKVEAGQLELDVATFSLREALERAVVMVRERATTDGVHVALSADPNADVVAGDQRQIRQVISRGPPALSSTSRKRHRLSEQLTKLSAPNPV